MKTIPALILSIFLIYGCTQKATLNTQLPSEPVKLAETDSAGNFITAEYCFFPAFENDSTWRWDFSPYKITNPLNLKLPEMCEDSYSYLGKIDSKDTSLLYLPSMSFRMSTSTGKQRKRGNAYRSSTEKILNIYPIDFNYKQIDIPLLQKEDTTKILGLAGKSFPIKWNFQLDCRGKYTLDLQGTYYIRISGICSKEQLKIIENGENDE